MLASPYDLSSIEAPSDKYSGITIFYIEDKTSKDEIDAARPFKHWYGTKVQPWPNASWAEMYRFEKDDKAVGLIYNNSGTNAGKWIDEIKVLNSGLFGLEAIAATTMSFFAFMTLM